MKEFIKQLGFFTGGLIILIALGVFLPPTPRASSSHLFSKITKDSLLKNTPSPRLILVGGSNISMSINSQILQDSLHLHPVNTGISASIGLAYMVDHTLKHIKKGDVVVVSPEYSQFYNSLSYGTEDLTRIILDTSRGDIFNLRPKQLWRMLQYIPAYAFSKFKYGEYTGYVNDEANVYTCQSFNKYGDLYRHWNLGKRDFEPLRPLTEPLDEEIITILKEYKLNLEKIGARLFITFPAFHVDSYSNQKQQIKEIHQKLMDGGFSILGYPQRYIMADEDMFDSSLHLTKNGVEVRTKLLVEDIKNALSGQFYSYKQNYK